MLVMQNSWEVGEVLYTFMFHPLPAICNQNYRACFIVADIGFCICNYYMFRWYSKDSEATKY